MATIEIPDTCDFEVGSDQVLFNTQTNGDSIGIKGLHLNSNQAASLAHLINRVDGHTLRVEIKEVT